MDDFDTANCDFNGIRLLFRSSLIQFNGIPFREGEGFIGQGPMYSWMQIYLRIPSGLHNLS